MSPAMLLVRCGDFALAFPLVAVREVVACPPLGHADPACRGLAGVLAWRGRKVPVVDLRARLGVPAGGPPRHAVVVATPAGDVALAVDRVEALDTVAGAMRPGGLAGLAAVGRTGDRFVNCVDMHTLFDAGETARLRAETAA